MLTTLPLDPPQRVVLVDGTQRDAWLVRGPFRIKLPRPEWADGGEAGGISSDKDAGPSDYHWIVDDGDPLGTYYVLPESGAISLRELEAAMERERLAAEEAAKAATAIASTPEVTS